MRIKRRREGSYVECMILVRDVNLFIPSFYPIYSVNIPSIHSFLSYILLQFLPSFHSFPYLLSYHPLSLHFFPSFFFYYHFFTILPSSYSFVIPPYILDSFLPTFVDFLPFSSFLLLSLFFFPFFLPSFFLTFHPFSFFILSFNTFFFLFFFFIAHPSFLSDYLLLCSLVFHPTSG